MGQRVSDKPVIDMAKVKGKMRYIDSEGYACVADPPKKMSPEEKEKSIAVRKAKIAKKVAENKIARTAMQKAKEAVKKNPTVVNAEEYAAAAENYDKVMGR